MGRRDDKKIFFGLYSHFLMKYFRHGPTSGRREPYPISRAAAALAYFLPVKVNEGITGGVMINEGNRCLGKRMEDGLVYLQLYLVPPHTDFGPLDTTGDRGGLGKVVPLLVEKVTANLGDLIPSIEWACLIVNASDINAHVTDCRQSVPAQVERRE